MIENIKMWWRNRKDNNLTFEELFSIIDEKDSELRNRSTVIPHVQITNKPQIVADWFLEKLKRSFYTNSEKWHTNVNFVSFGYGHDDVGVCFGDEQIIPFMNDVIKIIESSMPQDSNVKFAYNFSTSLKGYNFINEGVYTFYIQIYYDLGRIGFDNSYKSNFPSANGLVENVSNRKTFDAYNKTFEELFAEVHFLENDE